MADPEPVVCAYCGRAIEGEVLDYRGKPACHPCFTSMQTIKLKDTRQPPL